MEEEIKNKVGRPSIYTPELLEMARGYLSTCLDKENKKIGTIRVNFPSAVGLAIYLNINRDTLYDWGKKYEDFSDILDDIQKEQEKRLLNRGLDGGYNSNIVKLVLGKHGYKEEISQRVEVDTIKEGAEKLKEIIDTIKNDTETKEVVPPAVEIIPNTGTTGGPHINGGATGDIRDIDIPEQ